LKPGHKLRFLSGQPTECWDCQFESIYNYTIRRFHEVGLNVIFAEKALEALRKRLRDCPAQSPKQFRQWCRSQIERIAAQFTPQTRKPRKYAKPFKYEQHGGNCFAELQDAQGQPHTWMFPAEYLDHARLLWPVHVKRLVSGKPYLARKVSQINPDRVTEHGTVTAHSQFTDFRQL
jgi:hypothetical protein